MKHIIRLKVIHGALKSFGNTSSYDRIWGPLRRGDPVLARGVVILGLLTIPSAAAALAAPAVAAHPPPHRRRLPHHYLLAAVSQEEGDAGGARVLPGEQEGRPAPLCPLTQSSSL